MSTNRKWLTVRDLEARGLGESSTIYRKYKRGEFPAPLFHGERRVWPVEVIEKYEAERITDSPASSRRNPAKLNAPPESSAA